MFDLITENKGTVALLATIIVSNVGLYILYNIHSNKQCDQLRKKEKIYDDTGKELMRLPIHKFLFILLQNQKIKDLYLKKSHEFRDLFEIPQKELSNVEYDKENGTVKFSDSEKYTNDIITFKVIKEPDFLNDTKKNEANPVTVKITERLNRGYLIPIIEFSKKNTLLTEYEENIVKGINDYLTKQNVSVNQKVNIAINMAKAIEYFMVRGIPFETLKLDWNNEQLLTLLEKVGSIMPSNKFSVNVELKTPQVSHLRLQTKFKSCLFCGCHDVDTVVAKELKNFNLGDNPASILVSSFSSKVIPLNDEANKKNE